MQITQDQFIATNKIGDYFYNISALGNRIRKAQNGGIVDIISVLEVKISSLNNILSLQSTRSLSDKDYPSFFIDPDGKVDVDGNIAFLSKSHIFSHLPLTFGEVNGHFTCIYCRLITLEGSPHTVNGHFECQGNNLTSLEGGPKKVEGCYYCYNNNLKSLKGAAKYVGASFDCGDNPLLESLEGGPEWVAESYCCQNCKLHNLKGIAKHIGGQTDFDGNPMDQLMQKDSFEDDLDMIADRF